VNIEHRLAKLERRLPEPTNGVELTFEQFQRAVCALFRLEHLKFDGPQQQVVAEWRGDETAYQAATQIAQLLNGGMLKHPGVPLILLTLDETSALLIELAAGRISAKHNLGQGDAHPSSAHLSCDPSDMDVRRLEHLCHAGNVALDVYSARSSDPAPQNLEDMVHWLHEVRDALRAEFRGQGEPSPETGTAM